MVKFGSVRVDTGGTGQFGSSGSMFIQFESDMGQVWERVGRGSGEIQVTSRLDSGEI